ncbi:MAG: HAMP domain-containing protein [Gammaproteobacteria bacterium]|nr:HAMP domain-containing protein [Gammaproteobacteria bacterium]
MKNRIIQSIILWFNDLPIKKKFCLTQFISMSIVLFLIIFILSAHEFFSYRQQLLRDARVMAHILGENSSAALIFEDKKTAEELLQSLRFNPAIISATLYLPDNKLFASYHRTHNVTDNGDSLSDLSVSSHDFTPILSHDFFTAKASSKSSLKSHAYDFGWRQLELFEPFRLPNQSVAIINLQVSFDMLYKRLMEFIGVIMSISLIALTVAMLLINRLQRIITQPLFELTDLMRVVSEKRNYTHRAGMDRHDEIGLLAQGVDTMLGVIEQHQQGLNRELRERNRAEHDLSAANVELHQRHQQLEVAYQELAHAHQQLIHSEKMASLGLLMAGVAHELNNPISYVYSNLEFIEEYVERLVNFACQAKANSSENQIYCHIDKHENLFSFEKILKTLRELIASCLEGTERVKKIVLDLRSFSRTDDIGFMPTQLRDGIESTLNFLTKQYRDRIKIHRDYDNLPLIECHPSQINQVFMNLLQNAIQSIPDKGDVWIRTESDSESVKIIIKDNGVGISQDNLNRIFDPFFTTKPVGMGTGLGLSIVYGIIKEHGGAIYVRSEIDYGTEFTVELPVHLLRI